MYRATRARWFWVARMPRITIAAPAGSFQVRGSESTANFGAPYPAGVGPHRIPYIDITDDDYRVKGGISFDVSAADPAYDPGVWSDYLSAIAVKPLIAPQSSFT